MPKNKKLDDSSSDSDSSGPRDRNPPPSKKSKSESSPTKGGASSGSSSSGSKSKSADDSWQLDKTRMVKINNFKGRIFVDIREYYDANGELKPGKKGISLTMSQYQKLKEIIPEVDEALKNN